MLRRPGLKDWMVLIFWLAMAAMLIMAVKLLGCHLAGYPHCGWWPHLVFLLGVFTVIGAMPFFLVDILQKQGLWNE